MDETTVNQDTEIQKVKHCVALFLVHVWTSVFMLGLGLGLGLGLELGLGLGLGLGLALTPLFIENIGESSF